MTDIKIENLNDALEWSYEMTLAGHKSDGCTFAPDMGIRDFCRMHDFLRRLKPVDALRADNLFFQGIMTKGIRYLPIAVIYWVAVRAAYLLGVFK